jgi:hypothetical protein
MPDPIAHLTATSHLKHCPILRSRNEPSWGLALSMDISHTIKGNLSYATLCRFPPHTHPAPFHHRMTQTTQATSARTSFYAISAG